jgi:hypothetical protein
MTCFMKRSSLQNRVSKLTLKKFYEIDPWLKKCPYNVGIKILQVTSQGWYSQELNIISVLVFFSYKRPLKGLPTNK